MPTRGYKQIPEHKQKIKLANKGKHTFYGKDNPFYGKSHSEKSKKKMSIIKKGKHISPATEFKKGMKGTWTGKHLIHGGSFKKGYKHPNWKGGITPLRNKIYNSVEYRLWRTSVFARDNYTCVWCGAGSGKGKKVILNADHIKPFAYFPELRFAIDNGRTLCVECHHKTDTYGGRTTSCQGNPN